MPSGLSGSVSSVYAPGLSLSQAGVVAGLDMTSEAALTKLAYLLALPGATTESVTREMSVSLRGELTEVSQPVFRHPDGILPERVQALTVLGYAIAQGDLQRVKDIMKPGNNWLLNDADYSGNTALVSEFLYTPHSSQEEKRYHLLLLILQLTIIFPQHIASTSPSVQILHYLLIQGASVHLRNRSGRTPLFLAANAGFSEHVLLLRKSGAHLHSDERAAAELLARRRPGIWGLAGVGMMRVTEREIEDGEHDRVGEDVGGHDQWDQMIQQGSGRAIMVGSAPS